MRGIALVLFAGLLISSTTQKEVDISNYPIVTTVGELSDYYDLNIDRSGRHENVAVTKYLDGSLELEYSYDLTETETYDPLFYSVTIEQERTVEDAREMYKLGKGALSLVGNSFSQGTIEIDSLDLPGDDTYYALRTYGDEPNGMFYIVRKGTRIYTMMISGLYTTDHSLIYDLLIPKIENLDRFEIVK